MNEHLLQASKGNHHKSGHLYNASIAGIPSTIDTCTYQGRHMRVISSLVLRIVSWKTKLSVSCLSGTKGREAHKIVAGVYIEVVPSPSRQGKRALEVFVKKCCENQVA